MYLPFCSQAQLHIRVLFGGPGTQYLSSSGVHALEMFPGFSSKQDTARDLDFLCAFGGTGKMAAKVAAQSEDRHVGCHAGFQT